MRSFSVGVLTGRPSLLNEVAYRLRRHWVSSIAGLVAVVVVLFATLTLATSSKVDWSAVARYLTAESVLAGVIVTIELTVISMILGTILALGIAAMRQSPSAILKAIAVAYMWLFRGTPLLVQLLFWFNIALFIPTIGGVSTNSLVTPFASALLGLTLNVAAYEAEIIRAGLLAVDRGQTEAGLAVGMRPLQVLMKIVLPQAARVIVPPTSNQFIDMLKATSLVSVIGTGDLLTATQTIASGNFLVIELLLVASAWYLIMTTVAVVVQWLLERRLSRSVTSRGIVRS
jgi:polar amino acid transport system permease protein